LLAILTFWNKAGLMRQSKIYHCFSMVLAILLLLLGSALADKITWSGEWGRIDSNTFDSATIKITKVTPKNFKFTIIAVSGAHVGNMEGVAEIKGNRAFYADKEKCRVIFKMVGANLTVEATEGCQGYAGAGVYFDGTYRKGEKVPTPTLKSRGIFQTEKEEQVFRQLVGRDYELFVDSMAMISEEDDLDRLGAKVVRGAVRGLFTIVEAIIIYRDANNIWAAVIDEDVVKYYTTVPEFQNRLPRTIEKWRESFKEKKVLFMNAPKAL
jgi:hypothetical protein